RGTKEASYRIKPTKFGAITVVTSGGPGFIFAEFIQTFWARVDVAEDADPLLPWNFYYWPCERGGEFGQKAVVGLRKYAMARKQAADTAGQWEQKNHQRANTKSWVGHCHNSAPASALFMQPKAKSIAGLSFDEEEMEFLAAEYFGNYGQIQRSWELK